MNHKIGTGVFSVALILLFPGLVLASGTVAATTTATTSAAALKADIERTGLQFFLDHAHPMTGMVRDRAENFDSTPEWNRVASIASTGFGLAVVANSASRGKMERAAGEAYVLRALRFARDRVARYKGWFVHFVDWETGERMWRSEYSTIDTALFLAGAMYATQVFADNVEIGAITRSLYAELDFIDMMTDGGKFAEKRTLSMAYSPEMGYTKSQWDMYAEEMILLVLGLGHPTKPLPTDAWLAWSRKRNEIPNGKQVMGLGEALFVHQYSQVFLDFRGFNDGFPNYHDNSTAITSHHRLIAQTDHRFKTLKAGFWGFSAGDSPSGYRVWSPLQYEGTVCVGCTVASAMFVGERVVEDLVDWINGPHREQVWGRYGFVDSVDLDSDWFAPNVLGITVGPAALAVANIEMGTSVWKDFMRIPEIARGLERASMAGLEAQGARTLGVKTATGAGEDSAKNVERARPQVF